MRWVGIRDAGFASQLLARRLGDGPLSRIRFAVKVVSCPHMRSGHAAVIGLVPAHRGARAAAAVVTLLSSLRHANGTPVDVRDLPLGLRISPREWLIVNLAAPDMQREPGAALGLGRAVLELADHHQVILLADARLDDPRLMPAYMDHGFAAIQHGATSEIVKLRREPQARR